VPSNLSLALIGCLHIKPMIIGNYLSLNKKRKKCVCVTDSVFMMYCAEGDMQYESNQYLGLE